MLEQKHKDTIHHAIWGVFDSIRSAPGTSNVYNCALGLLLLKYLSDCSRSDLRTTYVTVVKSAWHMPSGMDFYSLYKAKHMAGNGQRIDRALHAIEEANVSLQYAFQQISFNSTVWEDNVLSQLLASFAVSALDFRSWGEVAPEVVAFACDTLIKHIYKRNGDVYTPPEISQLIASLMQPESGNSVCDPCCGSGSMLIACSQLARQKPGDHGGCSLYGQEFNSDTWALAKINMALHGENTADLALGNTLRDPRLLDNDNQRLQTFDIVVSFPPFSSKDWGQEDALSDPYGRYWRGIPPRGAGDYAFISHMVETLKADTGRMTVVVTLGVLFRGGAEQQIRGKLLHENLVDAVIVLPPKMLPHTAIQVALLVLRKSKADDCVLFIDASRGYEHGKIHNVLREEDLALIEHTYRYRENVDKYARRVSLAEITANDHNLNVSRYVDTTDDDEVIDLRAVQAERVQVKTELAYLEAKLDELMREIK